MTEQTLTAFDLEKFTEQFIEAGELTNLAGARLATWLNNVTPEQTPAWQEQHADNLLALAFLVMGKIPLTGTAPLRDDQAAEYEMLRALCKRRIFPQTHKVRLLLEYVGRVEAVAVEVLQETGKLPILVTPVASFMLPIIKDAPMGLADLGYVWRVLRTLSAPRVSRFARPLQAALVENPSFPGSMLVRLFLGQVSGKRWEKAVASAQQDFPELEGLPPDLLKEILPTLPVPDEWFAREPAFPAERLPWKERDDG